MIAAIREYVNFITIEENIAYQQEQQAYRIEKTNFQQNFAIPYLQSDSAVFFHKHENNILLYNEYVVQFTEIKEEKDPNETIIDSIEPISEGIEDNQQRWKNYFDSIFSQL